MWIHALTKTTISCIIMNSEETASLINGISIIVPCYNAESRIKICFDHILEQQYNGLWEVIRVDNNSSDKTLSLARDFVASEKPYVTDVSFLHEPRQGRIWALLAGVKRARYNVICHVDDDNYLQSDFLRELNAFYSLNDVDAVGSLGSPLIDADTALPSWFNDFHFAYAVGNPVLGKKMLDPSKDWVYGACFSYKVECIHHLLSLGYQSTLIGRSGNSLLSGEDMEFLLALFMLRKSISFNSKQKFHHYLPPERLTEAYLLRLHYGFGLASPTIGLMRSYLAIHEGFLVHLRRNYFFYVLLQRARYLRILLIPNKPLILKARLQSLKGSFSSFLSGYSRWMKCKANLSILTKCTF